MRKRTVWTRQHRTVLEQLEKVGRYTARREYIVRDLEEHAGLVLEVYDWFVENAAKRWPKPEDVRYPVWVSFRREATMLPDARTVILELRLDEDRIMPVDINKWGTMLNYSYIPADEADRQAHLAELAQHGVNDAQAFLSRFYPGIKRGIVQSWERLFDDSVRLGNTECYGTVWELRAEDVVGTG